MNAVVHPEILLGEARPDEPCLPLASEGVQRYVWRGSYGTMLIEVRDGVAYVNGQRVMSYAEMRGESST